MTLHKLLKEYTHLLDENIISNSEFQKALFKSKKTNTSIAAVLMDHFQVPKDAIGKSLSDFHNCDLVKYDPKMPLASEVLSSSNLDKSQLIDQCLIPFSWDGCRCEKDGLLKVLQGLTDFEELRRVINQ